MKKEDKKNMWEDIITKTDIADEYIVQNNKQSYSKKIKNINFKNCIFINAFLSQTKWKNVKFYHCDFHGCDLGRSVFIQCEFVTCCFFECYFNESEFTKNINFENCKVIRCCLENSKFIIKKASDIYIDKCCCTKDLHINVDDQNINTLPIYNDFEEFYVTDMYKGGQANLYIVKPKYPTPSYSLNKTYAIRLIRNIDKMSLSSLESERKILQKIKSPYVAQLIEMKRIENYNRFYIVMEYALGSTLRVLLKRGYDFNNNQKRRIFIQSLKALRDLSYFNIIHRDINPNNIIIQQLEEEDRIILKLIDFGFSKILEAPKTNVTQLFFTPPGYLPPEVFFEESNYSIFSDQYSLAITLYEMWTGKHPFISENEPCTLDNYKKKIKIADIDFNNIEESYANVLKKCLSIDPEKRYKNINEALKELL
ncbi:MAG: protein kinase [Bacteroidales bacterium]|nr:protein kinase [Bacteroidales bacterium]